MQHSCICAKHEPSLDSRDEYTRRRFLREETRYVTHQDLSFIILWSCYQGYKEKLELTYELGIFVGNTDTSHNCWVCLPSHVMTFVRRDVKFDEVKAMRCSLEREIRLHVDEELLAPKEEPHNDV